MDSLKHNNSKDKRKINRDLIIGSSVFLSLFILFVGAMWLKQFRVSRNLVQYTILFPNVGTLQVEDNVVINGVNKGRVSKIYLHESVIAVVIKLDRKVVLTDSCKITVQNIGLMGERVIGIQLSDKGTPYMPNGRGKIAYIPGYFDSGISGTMIMAGDVFNKSLNLMDTLKKIINQTVGDSQAIDFFTNIANRLNKIVVMTEGIIEKNKPDVKTSIDDINIIKTYIQEILDLNKTNISQLKSNGKQLSDQVLIIKNKIDSSVTIIKNIISDIENGEGSIGLIVKDESMIDDLKKTVATLDTLINEVNDKGLRLRIKLGFDKK